MTASLGWRFVSEGVAERLRESSDALDEILAAHGVSDRGRFAARLVSEEVVLNALEHGGATYASLLVDPRTEVRRLVFEDDGVPFDPTAAAPHDPEPLATRGRGLVLIHHFAKEISYRREGDRNRLEVRLPD